MGHGPRFFVGIAFAVLALRGVGVRADVPSRSLIGEIGGATSAAAISGNYAVVGEGNRIALYDISTPTAVAAIGFSDSFGDVVRGVIVSGTLAYIAAGTSGLFVVDISAPATPSTIGGWNSPGSAEAVTLAGTTAYLADGPFGLQVIDITTPQQPARVGGFLDDSFLFDAAVSGNTLFLAAAGRGLLIADITDPHQPEHIASLDTPGWARAAAVAGARVIVADMWEGVRIIDVSNRLAPVEASFLPLQSWAMDVAVSGTTALVATGSAGLSVVDFTNSAAPSQVGMLAAPGDAIGVTTAGSVALLADGRAGLYVVNVTNPASPQLSDIARSLGDGQGVASASSYAYVAGSGALSIIDISNTARPRLTASFQGSADEFANFVAAASGYVYLGLPGQLITIDVSNPALPIETSRLNLGTVAFRDMALTNTLLLAATERDVVILDITTPSQPVLRSRILSGGLSIGVSIAGQYAYVAQSETGMTVLNIANPLAPSIVATYKPRPEFNAAAIEVANGYAYVGGVGFDVVNVSDPANPQFVASIPVGPNRLNRTGNVLYAAAGTGGVYEIDISTPSVPVITHRTIVPGFASEAVANGSNIAVSVLRSGLWLLGGSGPSAIEGVRTHEGRRHVVRADEAPPARFPLKRPAGHASQIVVTSTTDSGAGSLRAALEAAVAGDTITFDPAVFPPASPAVIRPTTALAWVGGAVTVDASNAGVILEGSNLSGSESGINLGSQGSTVKGLHIINFPGIGINVGGTDNTIGGSPAAGAGPLGEGNLASGNGESGIAFNSSATKTLVVGNVVGLPAAGQTLRFHQPVGVGFARTNGNTVGGLAPGNRNVIAGNEIDVGFIVSGHNTVIGNFIGTNIAGTAVAASGTRPSSLMGVNLEGGSHDNIITDNVIASENAIGMSDTGSGYNRVERNRIGVTASGGPINGLTSAALGIGIDTAYNLVSQNVVGLQRTAISISGSGDVFVLGNRIGTDPTGMTAIPNTSPSGSVSLTGARHAFIGGSSAADANLVSGNTGPAIGLSGAVVSQNFVLGNLVGVTATGSPLGNDGPGISIDSSPANFIQRNTIANNAGGGVAVIGTAANRFRRNAITANSGPGITNFGGIGISATPVITSSTSTTAGGSACAGCVVEIFSDSSDEGGVYEGEVVAGPTGTFSLTKGTGFTGPTVTATASNATGATSAFSFPVALNGTPPPGPGGLDATGSASAVSVQWAGVPGATSYLVTRRSNGGGAQTIASVSNPSYPDNAVSPHTAYVYSVRSIGPGGASAASTPALATTMIFSDDPIVPTQTVIRRAHLLELRTAVSAVRAAAGLAAPSWSDPSIVAGISPIRATHVNELRTNLTTALTALGIPLQGFTWTIVTGSVIHADDVKELRDAVR